MYADILPELYEGLSISSAHEQSLLRGIENAARFLLRNYNFRESMTRATTPLALGAVTAAIPADAGKIKAVRLRLLSGTEYLYKRLRRREEGQLPRFNGPEFYWTEGDLLYLDTKMPAAGYDLEIWYQTVSPAAAEVWLSEKYKDVLEHRTGYEMAPKKRKPEAAQLYSGLWQEDMVVLANYLQELEFGDMDLGISDPGVPYRERYPAL